MRQLGGRETVDRETQYEFQWNDKQREITAGMHARRCYAGKHAAGFGVNLVRGGDISPRISASDIRPTAGIPRPYGDLHTWQFPYFLGATLLGCVFFGPFLLLYIFGSHIFYMFVSKNTTGAK